MLLSHPVWHVAEAAASLLASLARLHWSEISRWLDDWLEAPDPLGWRLHYGAIEAAFCVFRFDDRRPTRFEKALERFAASPNPRIWSLCAEDAADIVLKDRELNVESIDYAAYQEYVRTWIGLFRSSIETRRSTARKPWRSCTPTSRRSGTRRSTSVRSSLPTLPSARFSKAIRPGSSCRGGNSSLGFRRIWLDCQKPRRPRVSRLEGPSERTFRTIPAEDCRGGESLFPKRSRNR